MLVRSAVGLLQFHVAPRCRRQRFEPPPTSTVSPSPSAQNPAPGKAQCRRVIRNELVDSRRELRRAIECQQVGADGVGKRKPEDPAYENAATLVLGLLPAATISINQLRGPRCEADLRGAALCGWAAEGEASEADLEGSMPALLSDAV